MTPESTVAIAFTAGAFIGQIILTLGIYLTGVMQDQRDAAEWKRHARHPSDTKAHPHEK